MGNLRSSLPKVLTIAGSDSGGGAGIQADLKTIAALGGYGMSAITAVTAQNTAEVRDIFPIPPEKIRLQIEAVVEDIGVDGAKTGMLSSTEVIETVSRCVEDLEIKPLVVDPVMISTSGYRLLDPAAERTLQEKLFPLADVITPNLSEAEVLCKKEVKTVEQMKEAAQMLFDSGPNSVVIKGGHLEDDAVDVFYDGKKFLEIRGRRINTKNTHGSGCTHSAALATYLAMGHKPGNAAKMANRVVRICIEHSLDMGAGNGPVYQHPESLLKYQRPGAFSGHTHR